MKMIYSRALPKHKYPHHPTLRKRGIMIFTNNPHHPTLSKEETGDREQKSTVKRTDGLSSKEKRTEWKGTKNGERKGTEKGRGQGRTEGLRSLEVNVVPPNSGII